MTRDYVYPVRAGGSFEELRFSLRSLEANVGDVRDVILVGALPKWAVNVKHIPSRPGKSKWENIPRAIRAACDLPGLTDTFVYMNDDFMILKPFDSIPMFHRGSIYLLPGYIRPSTEWNRGHKATARLLRELGHRGPLNSYELHAPMPMVAADMAAALDEALPHRIRVLQYRTFYGNRFKVGGEEIADAKPGMGGTWDKRGPFLSTSDFMFDPRRRKTHPVATFIKERFPEPSKYERDGVAS